MAVSIPPGYFGGNGVRNNRVASQLANAQNYSLYSSY